MKINRAHGVAAAVLLAGGLALAVPAAAHEEHQGDGERRVERIIIMSGPGHRDGDVRRRVRVIEPGDAGRRDGERRVRVIELGGPEGAHCGGAAPFADVNEASPDGHERTRIIMCGDRLSAADRAAKLEKALDRIQHDDELSAEHKARVVAALREAIDRLRDTR